MGPLWERRGRGRLLLQPEGLWLRPARAEFCRKGVLMLPTSSSSLLCSVEAIGPVKQKEGIMKTLVKGEVCNWIANNPAPKLHRFQTTPPQNYTIGCAIVLRGSHTGCAAPRRAAPRLEQRSKQSLLCAADRRRMTPPVCVHTLKTMCSNLKDMARRGAAHPVCDPLYSLSWYFNINNLYWILIRDRISKYTFHL